MAEGPLDIKQLLDIVHQESARLKLRSYSTEGESAFTLALALTAAVKKMFYEKSGGLTFSDEPVLEKKPVTQFVHRMRVDAMEKFNATTVFSVIEFAADEGRFERHDTLVSIVVYLEQKFLPEFLRLMKYPYIDSDDETEVKDGCGTLCNLIAGQYKKEISALGYPDIAMSPFESFINTAQDGLGIPHGVTEKFELSFEVEETKRLVVEMVTLSSLPKWGAPKKTAPKKILIIDDDLTMIKTVEAFLKSKSYEVLVAQDGKEGLARLKDKPNLIILDLQMPNMDGYEFIVTLKENPDVKQVPIIILTSKEGMSDIVKIEGIREYLIKPLQPQALLKSIQRCV